MATTTYLADPAGIFPTDAHRRVAAALPLATAEPPEPTGWTFDDLVARLSTDQDLIVVEDSERRSPTPEEVEAILDDLKSAKQAEYGAFQRVVRGEDGKAILDGDGEVQYEPAEGWSLTKTGSKALTGPIADEPPPLEGEKLKAAEAFNETMAEEEAEMDKRAAKERVERLKAELKEAEAEVES